MTEARGTCGGDNKSEMGLCDVFHGFDFSRKTIEGDDRHSMGVTDMREEEGELGDEGDIDPEVQKVP